MDAESDDAARDRALALAARGGDRQAFASLVRHHQARLFNFLLRLLGRREEAMDLTQDTFLKAWSALPDWQPTARFSTWLFQIGRNAAFDVLRRQQRIDFVSYDAGNPADEPGDPAPSPEQQCADRQRLRMMGVNARSLAVPNTAKLIYDNIARMVADKKNGRKNV